MKLFVILSLLLGFQIAQAQDDTDPRVQYVGSFDAGEDGPKCSKLNNIFYDTDSKIIPYAEAIANHDCPKLRDPAPVEKAYYDLIVRRLKQAHPESCIDERAPRFRRENTTRLLGVEDIPFTPVMCNQEGHYVPMDVMMFSGMLNGYFSKYPDKFEEMVDTFPDLMNNRKPAHLSAYNDAQKDYIDKMAADMSFFEEYLKSLEQKGE